MNESIKHEIDTKYKNINKVDLKNIKLYFNDLNPGQAKKYWDGICGGMTEDFPTLAKIRKFISEEFEDEEYTGLVDLSESALSCKICGMVYANKKDRITGCIHCPRCGGNEYNIIQACEDALIVFAQDNCFKCPLFEESGMAGVYGPLCGSHGLGKKEPECGECKCRGCCHKYTSRYKEPVTPIEDRKAEQAKKDWRVDKKKIIELSKNSDEFADTILSKKALQDDRAGIGGYKNIRESRRVPE